MNAKHEGVSQNAHISPSEAVPARPQQSQPHRLVPWILTALLLAGVSYYLTTRDTSNNSVSMSHVALARLPESYGLCAEPAKIYTVDENKPTVDCIIVRKDEILATGSRSKLLSSLSQMYALLTSELDDVLESWDKYQDDIVKKFYGGEPKAKKPLTIYDAPQGSIVVPGLSDAHAHLFQYGFKVVLPLDTAQSLDDVLDILETYIRVHPDILPSEWISGFGWDQTRWKNWSGEFPTAVRLNFIDPTVPSSS